MMMGTFSQKHKAKILVIDDHPVVRYGICRILNKERDLTVCGELDDGIDAIDMIRKLTPDIVIVDITLRNRDGLALTKTIRSNFGSLPVLILSMHDEQIYAGKALRSGASGYIMKEESSDKLVGAVKAVLKGETYLSERIRDGVVKTSDEAAKCQNAVIVDRLSGRERQVFLLMGSGHNVRAIAAKLCVSIKTIYTHRARIKEKLDLKSTSTLVFAATQWVEREHLVPTVL
jgi:DNA-binding NarL/FixJ family response regulator